ncbi:RbsD/FucU family protein [Acidisoma cladoniae]|jgi:L-fucose mutarotase|uniref:RbsD/FucU family protein n=1 Tax=Acidisoma cladoniae TaxID=3040935 RepID=UPI00254D21D0|nr:RbsD/FucU domain-containing protein [Acidisoma sp. PAMC 29798]
MLRHIDPILSPELLAILRQMGHGDEIAIVDANFPSVTMGKRVVRADGVTATHMAEAILKLMPLDEFETETAFSMKQVHAPEEMAPVCEEFEAIVKRYSDGRFALTPLERFAFYDRVRTCFAVVATAERRLYGNVILKKGVLRPGEG